GADVADLPLRHDRPRGGGVGRRRWNEALTQRGDERGRVVGPIEGVGEHRPYPRREDTAHARHEREDLPPLLRVALHACRPAPLLMTEGALAAKLLPGGVVG